MKSLRLFFFFLLALLVVTAVLSLILPVSQKIEKTITIDAPATMVYEHLARLENFNKWSVWNQQDSTVKHTLSGADGTVGAVSNWTGSPEISGDGKMEITLLEPGKKVGHHITFIKPQKRKADAFFTLNEINGVTSVTWNFELATPRPWNIFNLFYSMDKQMGSDFENGLKALKATIEKTSVVTKSEAKYAVTPMNFPATSYASIRQLVKWADISSFYSQHISILYSDSVKQNLKPGGPAGLFFEWDEKNQQTDMAAAIPVSAGATFANNIIRIENIPASKAVYVNYYGAYNKSEAAYKSIDKYLADNKLKQKSPVIEQYITDPVMEKDTARWLTKIIVLVE
ncbi:MAG: SRPBCC family protein [Chitinophagaceae bacterium]|nr:SRPBCC family protein [Chitinophagaceae bacterium]